MADDPKIEPQKTEDTEHTSPNNLQNTPPKQITRIEPEIPPTEIDEHHTKEDEQNRRDRKRFRIEVATLIVIFIYTTIAGYQGYKMRQATEAAKESARAATKASKTAEDTFNLNKDSLLAEVQKQTKAMDDSNNSMKETVKQSKAALDATVDNFRMDQRAWVGPTSIDPPEYAEGEKKVYVKEGQQIKATIKIINSGKTPALNVHNTYAFRSSSGRPRGDPFITFKKSDIFESTTVIQPGMVIYLNPPPFPPEGVVTKNHINDITSEKVTIYIIGIITYDDIFKRHHFSKFCMRLKPDLTTFLTCAAHNETD